MQELSAEKREQMRQYVENWKVVGPILEQERADNLAALTAEQARRDVREALRMAEAWMQLNPDYERECGLVQQQEIFQRWKPSKV